MSRESAIGRINEINEEESLVGVGLIDSLAVMQIVGWLEDTYDIDFADSGFDPDELRSVKSILGVIARHAA